MAKKYWSIQERAGDEAEILIYEFIGESYSGDGVSAQAFDRELKALGDLRKLTLRINSPGGDVFEGNAIYNILRRHRAALDVYIDGIAASIASVIAMAAVKPGDKIFMPENAMVMIHNPWGVVVGTSVEMRKMATTLDKVKTGLILAYSNKSRKSDTQISRWMDVETWFTAEEAVRAGLADTLLEPVKAAAQFDLSKFKNPPRYLRQQAPARHNQPDQSARRMAEGRKRTLEHLEAEFTFPEASGERDTSDVEGDSLANRIGRREQLQRLEDELSGRE